MPTVVQALTFPPVIAQALDLGDPGQEQTVFSCGYKEGRPVHSDEWRHITVAWLPWNCPEAVPYQPR